MLFLVFLVCVDWIYVLYVVYILKKLNAFIVSLLCIIWNLWRNRSLSVDTVRLTLLAPYYRKEYCVSTLLLRWCFAFRSFLNLNYWLFGKTALDVNSCLHTCTFYIHDEAAFMFFHLDTVCFTHADVCSLYISYTCWSGVNVFRLSSAAKMVIVIIQKVVQRTPPTNDSRIHVFQKKVFHYTAISLTHQVLRS